MAFSKNVLARMKSLAKRGSDDISAAMSASTGVLKVASATLGAEALNARKLTVKITDLLDSPAGAQDFWVELISAADASFAFSDGGKGSVVYDNTTAKKLLFKTDTAGVAEITITDTAVETVVLAIGGGPGSKVASGRSISVAFAA
jgi:hypothetical protein